MKERVPVPRSPLHRRRDCVQGHTPAPEWDFVELGVSEGGICLAEEMVDHPEQVPMLSLYQMDDDGRLLGEIWLSSSDLPMLIRFLEEQFQLNYGASDRRWLGRPDGPRLYFGESVQLKKPTGLEEESP